VRRSTPRVPRQAIEEANVAADVTRHPTTEKIAKLQATKQ
jgi:hypothetical protein